MIRYGNLYGQHGLSLVNETVVRKKAQVSNEPFKCIEAIINHFMHHPNPCVVPVYEFEVLKQDSGRWGCTTYRYDMKRLGVLDDYEKTIITLAKEEELLYGIYPSESKDPHIIYGVERYPLLIELLEELLRENRYRDLHNGNIMKDEDDSYKVIDLEGYLIVPFDRPENDWMRE